jgi:hypothetical protein
MAEFFDIASFLHQRTQFLFQKNRRVDHDEMIVLRQLGYIPHKTRRFLFSSHRSLAVSDR